MAISVCHDGAMQDNALGRQIRSFRRQAGLNQRELAAAVHRDRSWLAHVERGDYCPNAAQLRRIAECLGVSAAVLLRCRALGEAAGGADHMSRQAVRHFSSSWKGGYKSAGDAPSELRDAACCLNVFLDNRVADRILRGKLSMLGLGCREAACAALALLERGAQWARLALAHVGFPLAVIDKDNCCVNHLPRLCLAWADAGSSWVLFGEFFGREPLYLPPLLAWTDRSVKKYLLLEGCRSGDVSAESTDALNLPERFPQLLTMKKSLRHHCVVQHLLLRGLSEKAIGKWLNRWLQIQPD